MVRESLARRFKPAGFEQPEGSRKDYTKPRDELCDAFYRWMRELPEALDHMSAYVQYGKARKLIEPLGEIPYMEANALLAGFKPKTKVESVAGIFISACYNKSSERVIIFDLDAPEIKCIGYNLGENRVLVNNGEVGDYFGSGSQGIAINNKKAKNLKI